MRISDLFKMSDGEEDCPALVQIPGTKYFFHNFVKNNSHLSSSQILRTFVKKSWQRNTGFSNVQEIQNNILVTLSYEPY